jgi:DNA repair exonuclease SbcCD nuclease subunit
MKLIAWGDFHAHWFTDFSEVDDITGNSRFTQQLKALEFMRNYCLEHDIRYSLFAGDLHHKRKAVDQTVKNMVRDEIKKFGQSGILTVMIPGNHDQVDNSDFPQHSLHSYRELEDVVLLDRFEPYYLNGDDGEAFIYPAPYSKNVVMVKDEITRYANHAAARPECSHILLMHLGISGAYVGKGNYSMPDAFSFEDLHPDAFTFGVAGHFHKRQFLGGHSHFFYTGSPLQHSFNDEGEDKGFYVLDTETGTAEFVSIPAPRFITVKLTGTDPEAIKLIQEQYKGDFLRIQIDAEKVQELTEKLPDEVKYRVEPQKTYVEERRVDVDFSMSMTQIITEYAKKFNPDALEIGLEILREVEEA